MLINQGTGGGCRTQSRQSRTSFVPVLVPFDEKALAASLEAKQQAQEEALRIQEERYRREEENQRIFEHLLEHKPEVGSVIECEYSSGMKVMFAFFNPDKDIYPAIYVLMSPVPGDPPAHKIMAESQRGLKVFLNKTSRERLRRIAPQECFEIGGQMTVKGKVRIVGYAESKKAAHGEIILDG